MTPSNITFEIGEDAYGRRTTLTVERDYQNREVITIISHAASQRDETTTMRGLSRGNIEKALQAIQTLKTWK